MAEVYVTDFDVMTPAGRTPADLEGDRVTGLPEEVPRREVPAVAGVRGVPTHAAAGATAVGAAPAGVVTNISELSAVTNPAVPAPTRLMLDPP